MKQKDKESFFQEIIAKEKSAFVVDLDMFESNISAMQKAFLQFYPKIKIGYSYKTNYVPAICKKAHSLGCWAEVVSEMEVDFAFQFLPENGKSNIIYNGPIKSENSIEKIISIGGIINIDNEMDWAHIKRIINNNQYLMDGPKAKVALRLNFNYVDNESRFGIDSNNLEALLEEIITHKRIEFLGFHLHLPFRSLESFEFRVNCMIQVLEKYKNIKVSYINIGGGFFGRISKQLADELGISDIPTYDMYAKIIGEKFSAYYNGLGYEDIPTLFLEPGSSVIADAVSFISQIHTTKKILEKNIVITYTGRHLVSPTNKTVKLPIEIHVQHGKGVEDNSSNNDLINYHISGYTCIESDIIGNVFFNGEVSENKHFIEIKNVGSYSIVMGSNFILPEPAIYILEGDKVKLTRKTRLSSDVINIFQ